MGPRCIVAAVAALAGLAAAVSAAVSDGPGSVLPYPPTAVEIRSFLAHKVIYDEGETVRFVCELGLSNAAPSLKPSLTPFVAPPLTLQVWDECGLEPASKVAEVQIGAADLRATVRAELAWNPPAGPSYGHKAELRALDGAGRLLAVDVTLYEVCNEWQHIMRLGSSAAPRLASEDLTDEDLLRIVESARRCGFNAIELYAPMKDYYEMAPQETAWQSAPYRDRPTQKVAASRIRRLGELLRERGMRMICYNETSAINPELLKGENPDDYKIYDKGQDGSLKVNAHYYAERGWFTPNALKVADRFAASMAESVRQYGWDGLLTDSATSCFFSTANGFDAKGGRLTTLTPGQVGEAYFSALRKAVLPVNPRFRFFCQNVAASMLLRHYHWRQPDDKIETVIGDYMRNHYESLFGSIDAWSGELDTHYTPQKNYPQTYERYALLMNLARDVSGKPVLQWTHATGTPYPEEYSVEYTRPLLSVLAASRVMWHEHFCNYGGCWGPWLGAPVNRAQAQIMRFVTRFSRFLRAPDTRWVRRPEVTLSVESSRELFWRRTVLERTLTSGERELTVSLINLDSPTIRPQNLGEPAHGTPPVAFPVTVAFALPAGLDTSTVKAFAMDAEDEALRVLGIAPDVRDGKAFFAVPPVRSWVMLVIRHGPASPTPERKAP